MIGTSRFRILRPDSAAEAIACAAAAPGARWVGGGTALQLEWHRGMPLPPALISLGGIPALKGVSEAHERLHVGALTCLGDLERDRRVATRLPALHAALSGVAAPAVRNLATLGGNVAGRNGCLLPVLLALDASLVVRDAQGLSRRPLEAWLAGEPRAQEIIEAVELPVMHPDSRWLQRKIGRRAAFSPSVIGVAGVIEITSGLITRARLAVGGGNVVPRRLAGAEAALVGCALERLDWQAWCAELAGQIVTPDDAFRSGRYRRLVASHALAWGLGASLPPRRGGRPRIEPPPMPGPPGEIRLGRRLQPQRWHVRPDGAPKVTGQFAYLTDHRAPGMLVGRILRAGRPHARITALDVTRAQALPGVIAVVTHRDIRGRNAFGIIVQDQPALCHDKVRYVGDAVAAVAAIDAQTAAAALELIEVTYEDLPVVSSAAAALAPGAPAVHATGNLQRLIEYARGDTVAAFAACDHVVEQTYATPRQMHGFMETEGGWAALQHDGTLAVHAGGQHAVRDRAQLARILAIPEHRIRVVTSPTGGAFGGKDELTIQPALALLAVKSGRAVRLQLSRAESVLAGTKRHPMIIRMRTGCTAEGRILAQEVDLLADAGAYASLGPCVLETALEHATGPYAVSAVRTCGRLAYTNNGVGGAFRGFGANQMSFAVECQVDRLAARCGLSPVEMRRRNLKPAGSPGFFGQALAPSERLGEMLAAAAASPLWRRPRSAAADEEVIGVGMAMNHHGNGLGSVIPDPCGGRLRFAADGRIEACFTFDEMGQGVLAAIVATAAAQLGCSREDLRPVTGDAGNGPDSGSTTAARTTFVVWQTLRLVGPAFAGRLCAAAAKVLGRGAAGLRLGAGGVADADAPDAGPLISYRRLAQSLAVPDLPCVDAEFAYPTTDYAAGNARFLFASGACVARVAVSRVTGAVRVLDIDQHTAAGPVVDVAAYLGQQEGGAIQGMGGCLSEEALLENGRYLTANLDTYLMPGVADIPGSMQVHALEALAPGDTYGPRGVGELGIGAVTPAIANAVFDAIGVCPAVSPLSPETLLDAMAGGAGA